MLWLQRTGIACHAGVETQEVHVEGERASSVGTSLHPTRAGLCRYIQREEAWAVALAALGHCAGHSGRDNAFQTMCGTELADR